VSCYGLDGARALAADSHAKARAALGRATAGSGATELEQIADFIATRTT
jgi:geranylgeranyl diphosphate synthase type II